MFSSFDPLIVSSSLTIYAGGQIGYTPPEIDAAAVISFGSGCSKFEICVHDQALKRLVELAEQALEKLDISQLTSQTANQPADPHEVVTHVAGEVNVEQSTATKLTAWTCIEDDCPIDVVVQNEGRMFFRLGRSGTFELGFDAEPLMRLVELGREALSAVEALAAADECEAA